MMLSCSVTAVPPFATHGCWEKPAVCTIVKVVLPSAFTVGVAFKSATLPPPELPPGPLLL
jgi:hypothetical protein